MPQAVLLRVGPSRPKATETVTSRRAVVTGAVARAPPRSGMGSSSRRQVRAVTTAMMAIRAMSR